MIGFAGLILLINLGYDRQDSKAFLALFLLVAIPLTIRFNAARQEWQWQAAHIAYPTSLGWRFMSVATGLTVGLLVCLIHRALFRAHGADQHGVGKGFRTLAGL